MPKFLSLLAAAFLSFCLTPALHASIGPLTLSPPPESDLAPDTLPQKLTLRPSEPILPNNHFVVGRTVAYQPLEHTDASLKFQPPAYLRDQSDFIRQRITTPDFLDRLGTLIDFHEIERPWSTTTTVHFLAAEPTLGKLVPFATLAHEIDADEDSERLGLGAGAMLLLGKNISFGAEVIYLGSDHSTPNSGFNREALFLSRLQIDF